MRSMLENGLVSALILGALAAGCGNVVVDAPAGSGGQGGAGGGGGNGGGVVTSSVSVTSSSSSVSVSSSNVTSSSSSSSSAFVSSSSGPNGCDNSGDCGDQSGGGCIDCSIQGGPCTDAYEGCFNSDECSNFLDCLQNCNEPNCDQQCAQSFPAGAQQYQELIVCVLCIACPNDCSQYQASCP